MFERSRGVVVAVSGGPDSVALLDMLMLVIRGWGLGVGDEQESSLLAPRTHAESLSPIPRLHVAHLDHMLRGRESAEDADFVRALAEKHGLQVSIGSADVGAAAKSSGRSVEEIARELRYKFLLDVAHEKGCDRIAVGHTMTDQAETFLMRLTRGAGSRGLASMRPVTPAHAFPPQGAEEQKSGGAEGKGSTSAPLHLRPRTLLVRPLLCITREEVEDYCRERELVFRIDHTNESLHYTRNRVRNEIFPLLNAINPRVAEAISRAADNLATDQDALQSIASVYLDGARKQARDHASSEAGVEAYSIAAFIEQPAGIGRRMIIEAVRCFRSSTATEVEDKFGELTSRHVASIESLLKLDASGKRITLPGGFEVWREFDALVFKSLPTVPDQYQVEINSECPRVDAGGFAFSLERGVRGDSLNVVIKETQREARLGGLDWLMVAVDDFALPECLLIRPRRPGERARVLGQSRTKKLKNLMIDHRIPSSRRANWPIVTTPSGCYVWSPGLPPALQFAARDETTSLAVIRAATI